MNENAAAKLVATSRKVADLILDPANVRTHSDRNLDAIRGSLARFGQQTPIVVDGDGIVRKGNGTVAAAKTLGWENLWCIETDLKGSEATAYAIADNRTGELAEWDDDALKQQLEALVEEDAELFEAAGFTDEDLDELLETKDVEAGTESMKDLDESFKQEEKAEHGEILRFKNGSVLICCHPTDDLAIWREHLTDNIEKVVTYPSVLAPFSKPFSDKVCLYLQPIKRAFSVTADYGSKQYPDLIEGGAE